jgi:Fe-S cluster assembly protein SufD
MSIATIDPSTETKQRFEALFASLDHTLNGQKSHPLHELRMLSREKLTSLDLPTLRNEDWKYTSLAKVYQHKYVLTGKSTLSKATINEHIWTGSDTYVLVFVNGILQEELSNLGKIESGLQITTLQDAYGDDSIHQWMLAHVHPAVEGSAHAMSAINNALIRQGTYIHISKGTKAIQPIQILHIFEGQEEAVHAPYTSVIRADQESELTILERFVSVSTKDSAPVLGTSFTYAHVGKAAHLRHYKLQELNDIDFLVHQMHVEQQRDSVFSGFTGDFGGKIVRNNVDAIHQGQYVTSNLYGVFLGKRDTHIDNQTLIDHAIPNCQSNEWYKGILRDKSRGVFNGKVMVRPDAQKTNAFQQNNTLILSEQARMDAKPQLEIFADDVKCSHGATIGQMNEDAVFYLRSRGLSELDAKALLQLAFVQEVTGFIEDESIKNFVETKISTIFGNQG